MPEFVRTLYWTSTEACEVIELVEERLNTKTTKESIREELCWLNETIHRNPRVEWVAVLKNPPEEFKQVIPRKNFKAYLVRRWERILYPERKVWMLYIVPR